MSTLILRRWSDVNFCNEYLTLTGFRHVLDETFLSIAHTGWVPHMWEVKG